MEMYFTQVWDALFWPTAVVFLISLLLLWLIHQYHQPQKQVRTFDQVSAEVQQLIRRAEQISKRAHALVAELKEIQKPVEPQQPLEPIARRRHKHNR